MHGSAIRLINRFEIFLRNLCRYEMCHAFIATDFLHSVAKVKPDRADLCLLSAKICYLSLPSMLLICTTNC